MAVATSRRDAKRSGFERYERCPVCTSAGLSDKYRVGVYTLSECSNCTALFVREILSPAYLDAYYQGIENEKGFAYEADNSRFLEFYYRRIKKEIEKIKPAKGAILDVGCSSGFFLNQMAGWERHGIEITEKFGNMARQKIGDTIFIGPFEDYPSRKDYFDVVTMQDVFDHFIDPYQNLMKCCEMLKPGGLLLIKVHNISCLYAKITGAAYAAIIPPQHLFYFNEKSLKLMLERAGLQFARSRFIGHLLQLKTVFFRLSRDGEIPFPYRISQLLGKSFLGSIPIYKNMHDIITVFALKPGKG